jgi:hypothetical protein
LLEWGLLIIREQARAGRMDICEIEADHIHNLPSLIGDPNEQRHKFFIGKERGLYLQRLRHHGDSEYVERRVGQCTEPWRVLASIAGVSIDD